MRQARHFVLGTALATLAAAGAVTVTAGSDEVPFPSSYRTWAHVKTVLIGPASAAKTEVGIHHIYANEPAMVGYRTGTFPDGSVIVYELLETTEKDGATSEGAEKRIDVMAKDGTRFAANAGWAFGRFRGGARSGGTLPADQQAACLKCHAARKDHDYVHSDWRR